MTDVAWSWLPDGALGAPPVLSVIDRAVADWCGRWWTGGGLMRQRLTFTATGSPDIVVQTACVSVRATPASVESLAGLALDMDLSLIEQSEDDRSVINAMAAAICRDLAGTLDTALDSGTDKGAGRDRSGPILIEFTDDAGRRVLTIETSRAMLADVRRVALPEPPGDASRPLVPIRRAIADTNVSLSAIVGSAEIALPDLRRLAPGDVIVLNRPLDQPLDLVADVGGGRVACAGLVDAASPRSLRLQAPSGRNHP